MKWLFVIGFIVLLFTCYSQSGVRDAELLYQEAYEHFKNQELGLARSLIEESFVKYETSKARYLNGLMYESEGRELRAVSEYEAAVKLDPQYREAIFNKALIYLRFGDPSQTVSDLTTLINTQDQIHETTTILFQVDEAGANQNRIMTTNMMEAQLYHYRGQAYQKLDQPELALNDFENAISIEKKPDYLISRGLLYVTNERYDQAVKDFEHAISLDSGNHVAWYNLAVLEENTKIPISLIQSAEFAPTLSLLASREIKKGDLKKAITYLDKAIAIDATDAFSLINRGRILLKLSQYGKARRDFNTAFEISPKNIECLYLIGNAYFFEKNFKNALAYYDQYLAVDGLNGMIWYNAAMCHFEMDNSQEGCHYLQLADQMGMEQAMSMRNKHCK